MEKNKPPLTPEEEKAKEERAKKERRNEIILTAIIHTLLLPVLLVIAILMLIYLGIVTGWEKIQESISDIPWIQEEMSTCNRPLPVKG